MEINAADVKKLRDLTGAPIMDCKAALVEANGDMTRAQEILRVKNKAAAEKRADRATAEGNVVIVTSDDKKKVAGVVIESETDFVAINESFQAICKRIGKIVLDQGQPGVSAESALTLAEGGETVAQILEAAVGTIRENIKLTDAVVLNNPGSIYGAYVHHDRKKGAIVELEAPNNETLAGKNVAMQVVAHPPSFIAKSEVPKETIDKEMEIQKEKAMEDGKPAEMAEKIAAGRINKEYYQSVVLLEQPFLLDNKMTVDQYLTDEGKAAGGTIKILSYRSLKVGG